MKSELFGTIVIAVVLLFFQSLLAFQIENSSVTQDRQGKLFIPAFVTLKPDPCKVGNDNGTCYTSTSCTQRGGMKIGTCGIGNVGTCCKFELKCSNSSTFRIVEEREVTIKDSASCSYEFPKMEGYCQLKVRLDNVYNLPSKSGDCDGVLTIKGSSTVKDFPFCGTAPAPIYLAYGDERIIRFEFAGSSEAKNYDIHVTQIRCDSRERVPDHCLQQFDSITGEITSFGFKQDGNGGYIADQKYTVCIKQKKDQIKWEKCSSGTKEMYPYTTSPPLVYNDFFTSHFLYDVGVAGQQCENGNYVAFSGAKYCGSRLRKFVKTSVTPFTLTTRWMREPLTTSPYDNRIYVDAYEDVSTNGKDYCPTGTLAPAATDLKYEWYRTFTGAGTPVPTAPGDKPDPFQCVGEPGTTATTTPFEVNPQRYMSYCLKYTQTS